MERNVRNERADGIYELRTRVEEHPYRCVIRERHHVVVDSSTRYKIQRITPTHAADKNGLLQIKCTWRCAEALENSLLYWIVHSYTAVRTHYLSITPTAFIYRFFFASSPFLNLVFFCCFCLKNKSFACFNYYYYCYALRAQLQLVWQLDWWWLNCPIIKMWSSLSLPLSLSLCPSRLEATKTLTNSFWKIGWT